MKSLCKDNFNDIEKEVLEASENLKSAQLISLQDPSHHNVLLEATSRESWLVLRLAEERFFRQRSRIKWLAEGDLNTSFFHHVTTIRNAFNAVKYLIKQDGSRAESSRDIHKHTVKKFTK